MSSALEARAGRKFQTQRSLWSIVRPLAASLGIAASILMGGAPIARGQEESGWTAIPKDQLPPEVTNFPAEFPPLGKSSEANSHRNPDGSTTIESIDTNIFEECGSLISGGFFLPNHLVGVITRDYRERRATNDTVIERRASGSRFYILPQPEQSLNPCAQGLVK